MNIASVPLRDYRAQGLYACSDHLALGQLRERHPDIVSDAEAAAIEAAIGREVYGGSPWAGTDEEVVKEFWGCTTPDAPSRRTVMLRFLMGRPANIIDIGAFMGAHAVHLSNQCGPETRVTIRERQENIHPGIRRMIELHAQWPAQCVPSVGDERGLPENAYDCVWLGEVLEHQADPLAFLSTIEAACTPGAQIILSTPLGPWETSSETHNHVAHWEPNDYTELAGHRPDFAVVVCFVDSVPSIESTEDYLKFVAMHPWRYGCRGYCIARWRVVKGDPLRPISYARKLRQWGFA